MKKFRRFLTNNEALDKKLNSYGGCPDVEFERIAVALSLYCLVKNRIYIKLDYDFINYLLHSKEGFKFVNDSPVKVQKITKWHYERILRDLKDIGIVKPILTSRSLDYYEFTCSETLQSMYKYVVGDIKAIHEEHLSEIICELENIENYENELAERRFEKTRKENIRMSQFTFADKIRKHTAEIIRVRSTQVSELVGCSGIELRQHLEKKFKKGMCWENRKLWHIDHIIPLSLASNDIQMSKLAYWSNLQPLWAHENLQKGVRLDWQPGVAS
jgi:hypothetical protein